MRKKTKVRPVQQQLDQQQLTDVQLVPCSEWTREGEVAGWMDDGASQAVAEILCDVQKLPGGAWFEDDGSGGIALSVDEGVEVPDVFLQRLKAAKADLLVWFTGPGARYLLAGE